MIRSLLLLPQRYYPRAVERNALPSGSSYCMVYGQVKSWQIEDSWCCIQWYKSKYMLPYCIEIKAMQPLYLPVACIHPDTHWQYMLRGSFGIQQDQLLNMLLGDGQQHKIHTKPGEFLCYLPAGHHILVGYTIAARWLEKHNLHTLLTDNIFRSEALPISPAMLSEWYYLLQHPKLQGIQQDTNIYAAIGRLQHAHNTQQNSLSGEPNIIKEKIEAIHHYIHLLLADQQMIPTVEEILVKYKISHYQLAIQHQQLYGKSLAQYIIDTRLSMAASLLAQGLSIKEVSYLLHYHDLSAFSNAFKKKYGLRPSEYRGL